MSTTTKIIMVIAYICLSPLLASSQENEPSPLENVRWQEGPSIGELGKIAKVEIPEGYIFADGNNTRLIMEAMHNPTSDKELGFIARADSDWFLVFEFVETGYIKDDEKNSLDADALLKSIKKANEATNRKRSERGWAVLNVLGWEQPPLYNPTTHNLEWAVRGESRGEPIINWNTRLLGRRGVMRVTLVAGPELLSQALPYYQSLLSGFDYKRGNRYGEFRQGDKVAKYGLSALVAGGATAVAAKTGILKYLWKGLVVAFLAVIAFFKKIFFRKKGRETG